MTKRKSLAIQLDRAGGSGMIDSDAAFEAWWSSTGGGSCGKQACADAFEAGRASMKAEAIKVCEKELSEREARARVSEEDYHEGVSIGCMRCLERLKELP